LPKALQNRRQSEYTHGIADTQWQCDEHNRLFI
jgi:hypothetical protein